MEAAANLYYPWQVSWDRVRATAPLKGLGRAQIAVIGGGIAGLSAAYHLRRARPDLDVALLEARFVGSGASGRSTGMVGPGVGGTLATLRRRFGDVMATAMYRATVGAVNLLIRLVNEEELDCDMEISGQLKVAMTRRQAHLLQREAEAFDALGLEAMYYDARRVSDLILTASYQGALRYPRAANINPARLCQELKRVLLRDGVRIHENTPVKALNPGKPVELILEQGALHADQVIVATDGYTGHIGLLAGRIVPLHTHVIMTEPLSQSALDALGWRGREAIIDCRTFFNYYRLTPDNRVLFGGAPALYRADKRARWAGAVDCVEPSAWDRLERELMAVFPVLRRVHIDQRWAGTIGCTLDNLPVVGNPLGLANVLFTGGWCGHGLALAMATGEVIADKAIGASRRTAAVLPWFRGNAPMLPPDPWRSAALDVYLALLDRVDRLGNRIERTRTYFLNRIGIT
jgi:gamma-glutamylputrescine oxidase